MTREFRCPSCGRKLVIPGGFAYRRARCPSCREIVEVPSTPQREPEDVRTRAAPATPAVEGARAVQQTVEKPDSPLGPRAYLPQLIVRVLRQDEEVIYWGRPSWVVLAMREAWLVLGVLLPTSAVATLLSYVGFRFFVPLLFLVAFLIIIAVGALLFCVMLPKNWTGG